MGRGAGAIDRDRLALILDAAGLDAAHASAVRCEPLPGGTYNTLYRLHLRETLAAPGGGNDAGPHRLILKLPPEPGTARLTYEANLLRNEAEFYRAAARGTHVQVPKVLHCDPDGSVVRGGFLLMSECPGQPWYGTAVGDVEHARLRRQLGASVAELHTVAGPSPYFGYPSGAVPTARTWRRAFTSMLDAVLADASRFACRLPVRVDRVRTLMRAAAPELDAVTVPALVHFDLWQGNILLSGEPGALRLSGLIDGERMFWGDPLAEFVSLNLFGAPEDDAALLAGYRSAGRNAEFDDGARLRVALYRCYLYLIMLIESVPRGYTREQAAETRDHASPALVAALDTIANSPSAH
ncbi:phosphotransferase [Streptomyces sp. 150FB]|uniref:phosphotransferase family protein n=1 Tax=Streptomyces sp. 150FB TaxID=1576605 RepID=UPI00069887D4|nr:phosphotransferase [Streptomyces sp. 150FB]